MLRSALWTGHLPRGPPFDVAIGRCAVLEDPFGNVVCLLDMSKGRRVI
jgi:predicted enzyme related to lactoylglutathione lyase